jgi:hypothetical protein
VRCLIRKFLCGFQKLANRCHRHCDQLCLLACCLFELINELLRELRLQLVKEPLPVLVSLSHLYFNGVPVQCVGKEQILVVVWVAKAANFQQIPLNFLLLLDALLLDFVHALLALNLILCYRLININYGSSKCGLTYWLESCSWSLRS